MASFADAVDQAFGDLAGYSTCTRTTTTKPDEWGLSPGSTAQLTDVGLEQCRNVNPAAAG